MNIFAKFHENIPNLSQEIEKNTENKLPPPPPKKTKLKIAPSKGQPPYKAPKWPPGEEDLLRKKN